MWDVNIDCHERRMNEVILKAKNEDLGNILACMSGYAGNHEFFNEVFWSAVDNMEFETKELLLDYNKLLDDWADKISEKIDQMQKLKEKEDVLSTKYCTISGYIDGLAMSWAILGRLEKKAKKVANN